MNRGGEETNVRNVLLSFAATGAVFAVGTELAGATIGVDLPAMAGLVFGIAAAGVTHVAMIPFRQGES